MNIFTAVKYCCILHGRVFVMYDDVPTLYLYSSEHFTTTVSSFADVNFNITTTVSSFANVNLNITTTVSSFADVNFNITTTVSSFADVNFNITLTVSSFANVNLNITTTVFSFADVNFNTQNECLIEKLLKQGYRYHKLRKAFFFKFYCR